MVIGSTSADAFAGFAFALFLPNRPPSFFGAGSSFTVGSSEAADFLVNAGSSSSGISIARRRAFLACSASCCSSCPGAGSAMAVAAFVFFSGFSAGSARKNSKSFFGVMLSADSAKNMNASRSTIAAPYMLNAFSSAKAMSVPRTPAHSIFLPPEYSVANSSPTPLRLSTTTCDSSRSTSAPAKSGRSRVAVMRHVQGLSLLKPRMNAARIKIGAHIQKP